jgi:hypothetical protein
MARLLLLVAATALLAAACGAAEEPQSAPATADETTTAPPPPATAAATTTTPATTTEERPAALPGLPRYTAGYEEWPRLNSKPIPPRDSDPHLGTKQVYASKSARSDGVFPNGTIIVKEAARPGKDFVGLVAVMRKRPGADPAHNDWVFVEWTREAPDERFSEAASGAVCWSCHAGAAERDYVWISQLGLD